MEDTIIITEIIPEAIMDSALVMMDIMAVVTMEEAADILVMVAAAAVGEEMEVVEVEEMEVGARRTRLKITTRR